MNYQAHYEKLIQRAVNRTLNGYVERHHILPKCMGGTDDKDNLVQLTAEEHYVAHQLLHKIHPEVCGLAFAMVAMTSDHWGHRSNKLYGWVRAKWAESASAQSKAMWLDPEYRARTQASMQKAFSNPEFGAKISKANTGRVKSEQERKNIAEAGRNRKPRVFSEQARANMAAARLKTWEERRANGSHLLIGQKTKAARVANGSYEFSAEHRANIGESAKGRTPWNKGVKAKNPGYVSRSNC